MRLKSFKDKKNYANSKSGAIILASSKGVTGKSAILEESGDSYI